MSTPERAAETPDLDTDARTGADEHAHTAGAPLAASSGGNVPWWKRLLGRG